jgi:hydroxypyruvate reductase
MSQPANESIGAIRKQALSVFQAGVAAADPYQAVKKHLSAGEYHLEIGPLNADSKLKRTGRWRKVHLIAFGKAACAMSKAAQEIIPVHMLAENGIAVTNTENVEAIAHIDVLGASHPLPDAAGLNAAKIIADRVSRAQRDELVLVLVSGGGSALIPYPIDAITLNEKCAATELLLASGATINQINCVRKHLSRLKGGGLARMAYPADCHALVLSDVLGDDISSIASGPTVPDSTTFADAITVFKDKKIWNQAPAAIRDYLELGRLGKVPETPKPDDKIFDHTAYTLIGSNAISLRATIKAAQELGYETIMFSDQLSGIAREVAEQFVISAKTHTSKGINKAIAILAGGETTVIVKGNGRGGRNQEMALAFALAAEKHQLDGRWAFLSGGTDGLDGPTDAAGGLVDPDSLKRMIEASIDPQARLDNNDSYHALETSEDLLDTGATGTNVADLQVLLIHPPY